MHDAPAGEPADPVTGEVHFSATATLPEASRREMMHAGVVTGFVSRGDGVLCSKPTSATITFAWESSGNSRGGSRAFGSLGTVAVREDRSEAMKSSGTKANKAHNKKPQRKPRQNAVR